LGLGLKPYFFKESLISVNNNSVVVGAGGGATVSSFFFDVLIAFTIRNKANAIMIKEMTVEIKFPYFMAVPGILS
jgi:hypothetical protein